MANCDNASLTCAATSWARAFGTTSSAFDVCTLNWSRISAATATCTTDASKLAITVFNTTSLLIFRPQYLMINIDQQVSVQAKKIMRSVIVEAVMSHIRGVIGLMTVGAKSVAHHIHTAYSGHHREPVGRVEIHERMIRDVVVARACSGT